MAEKPTWVFDRDVEWRHLEAFASRGGGRPRLGVISGRRRQGKTYLLQALIQAAGGTYFGATQATARESLAMFGDALAAETAGSAPPRFVSWDEAIRHLFALRRDRTGLLVMDEFPYLAEAEPALPSILQREIDRGVVEGSRLTLLLSGSAMSVMGGLLGGSAPLRGRAGLELVLRPFPHRLAARYWRVDDPALALRLHAVVGGTPAYLRFVDDDTPQGLADFDDWVVRTVLNPATPLFREARYLLEEETAIRDAGLYHSVLAAVAGGNGTRGGIANYIGRRSADIGHHLNVLEDAGLLRRDQDLFRAGRSRYRVAEPMVTFYQVVMRPQWGPLESGRGRQVWQDARARFAAQVLGPHFEQLCRDHALAAPPAAFGELPGEVGAGVVADPARRSALEIDVVVLAAASPGRPRRVLSLGEAKLGEVMGARHLQRLRRARDLLAERGYDTCDTVLACYSGAGFEPGLGPERPGERIALFGLGDLFGGDPGE